MKKILLVLTFVLSCFIAQSQIINFETTTFTHKELTPYGWTDWSRATTSSMRMTINLDRDLVTIYSPKKQIYRIIDYVGQYADSDGDYTIQFDFIDQDSDFGTMRLVQRRNGRSEVYIQFLDVIWCYSVIRR